MASLGLTPPVQYDLRHFALAQSPPQVNAVDERRQPVTRPTHGAGGIASGPKCDRLDNLPWHVGQALFGACLDHSSCLRARASPSFLPAGQAILLFVDGRAPMVAIGRDGLFLLRKKKVRRATRVGISAK